MPLGPSNIVSDVIGGAGGVLEYSALLFPTDETFRRVCIVNGLGQYSSREKAVADALALVIATHPVGEQYPGFTAAIARRYEPEAMTDESGRPLDDSVRVIIHYIFAGLGFDPTIWTLESRSFSEPLETDVQYDGDGNLIPIAVDNYIREWYAFQDKNGNPVGIPYADDGTGSGSSTGTDRSGSGKNYAQPQPPVYGTVVVPKPRKQWVMTRRVLDAASATTFDTATLNYQGRINSVVYKGTTVAPIIQNLNCAAGTVLCEEAGVSYDIEGNYIARLVLTYKPEGHQPYIRYIDPETGTAPGNVWRAGRDKTGPYDANGVVRTTAIQYADLNVLLTLLDQG